MVLFYAYWGKGGFSFDHICDFNHHLRETQTDNHSQLTPPSSSHIQISLICLSPQPSLTSSGLWLEARVRDQRDGLNQWHLVVLRRG